MSETLLDSDVPIGAVWPSVERLYNEDFESLLNASLRVFGSFELAHKVLYATMFRVLRKRP